MGPLLESNGRPTADRPQGTRLNRTSTRLGSVDRGGHQRLALPAAFAGVRRIPDHTRDRPGRHGRRLRGRGRAAEPPRCPQGFARELAHARKTGSAVQARSPGRQRDCTIPISCRSSASAKTMGIIITSCSTLRERHWRRRSMSKKRRPRTDRVQRRFDRQSRANGPEIDRYRRVAHDRVASGRGARPRSRAGHFASRHQAFELD